MPSPLGKVSPKVTEEVRTFVKQKCIAEGDLCGNIACVSRRKSAQWLCCLAFKSYFRS